MLGAQGPVCIVEFPDLAQRLAYRLMKRFWQTFDHVAGLVVRRTTLLKASAPSTMNSRQTSGIEPSRQARRRDRPRLLCGSIPGRFETFSPTGSLGLHIVILEHPAAPVLLSGN